MTNWKITFSYLNTYRDRKGVTTFVDATTKAKAVQVARERIEALYGIARATLKTAQIN